MSTTSADAQGLDTYQNRNALCDDRDCPHLERCMAQAVGIAARCFKALAETPDQTIARLARNCDQRERKALADKFPLFADLPL